MRASIVMPAVVAVAVLGGAGAIWASTGTTTSGHPAAAEIGAVAATNSASATPSATVSIAVPSRTPPKTTATPSLRRSGTARPGGVTSRSAPVTHAAPRPAAHHSCGVSSSAPGASSMEAAIFAMLNQERAANGLCPMTWSPLLQKSAHGHSVLMDQKSSAADCSDGNYSHDYPGEPAIDQRIFATGYPHGPVAEAIGCSPDPTLRGAESLQQLMYDEKPPNNQHREMILSSIVDHVGISIVVDPNDGTLWLTEDYGS